MATPTDIELATLITAIIGALAWLPTITEDVIVLKEQGLLISDN